MQSDIGKNHPPSSLQETSQLIYNKKNRYTKHPWLHWHEFIVMYYLKTYSIHNFFVNSTNLTCNSSDRAILVWRVDSAMNL